MNSHPFKHLGRSWTLFRKQEHGPWYFAPRWGDRGQKKFHCLRDSTTAVALPLPMALQAAMDLITARFQAPDQYAKLREQTKLRKIQTVGAITGQWNAAGCPRPNGIPRGPDEQRRQREHLRIVDRWWADRPVVDADGLHGQYARWRRDQARGEATGNRSIELELVTLSNAFRWAAAERLVDANPFEHRESYRSAKAIRHAPDFMPGNPEELHRISRWLFATQAPLDVIAGAQLLFMGLTGLRRGEPGFLRWDARFDGNAPEPGHIFERELDGRRGQLLCVRRLKGGINPAVEVRPALSQFLNAWKPYARSQWPESPFWFADPARKDRPFCRPEEKTGRLADQLTRAVKALDLPERHAHGMRAYYVRVRRSQGATDAVIADELGESSGAKIIASTYGRADAIRGDGRFTWLPGPDLEPAWTALAGAATNIIAL
jgi:integrase